MYWEESDISWASRWDAYLNMPGGRVHWFSILNSLMVVLVMSSIVAMIMMRTIRRDLQRYEGLLGDAGELELCSMHHCHGHKRLAAGQCHVICDCIAQAMLCMHCPQMLTSSCEPLCSCLTASVHLLLACCLQAMIWKRVAGKWFPEMSSAHPKMLSYCVSRLAVVCRSSHQPLQRSSLLLLVCHSINCFVYKKLHGRGACCLLVVLCDALQDGSSHHLHPIITPCAMHIYHNAGGACRCIRSGACPICSVMCLHDTVTVIIDQLT